MQKKNCIHDEKGAFYANMHIYPLLLITLRYDGKAGREGVGVLL